MSRPMPTRSRTVGRERGRLPRVPLRRARPVMFCELSSGASEGSGVKLASRTPQRCRRSLGHLHTKPRPGAKHYPEAYRAKHGLPSDYPMTSASYSAQRSELAPSLGLGQVCKDTGKAKPAVPEKIVVEEAAAAPEKPKKAGWPRKTPAAA